MLGSFNTEYKTNTFYRNMYIRNYFIQQNADIDLQNLYKIFILILVHSVIRKLAPNTYEIQKTTNTVHYDGYIFRTERIRNNKTYYRCTYVRRGCKARLSVSKCGHDLQYKSFREHNHSPNTDKSGKTI